MKSFEYASPPSIAGAISLLGTRWGGSEILAGGTDLVALMKDYAVNPTRVVNIKNIPGLNSVSFSATKGLQVGALVTMDELANHPAVTANYPTLALALADAASPQIRNRATVGGNLCQRPRCWYFRNGYGLLALDAKGKSLVLQGDNRYHAILGNSGPAYFISPSTMAPTLIAFGAQVTMQGPKGKRTIDLADFYVTPTTASQREHALEPNEVVVGIQVPPAKGLMGGYYEVRQKFGFDWPFATATAVLTIAGGKVSAATLMLSHVAPVPWRATQAEQVLIGQQVTPAAALAAAQAALQGATSLGQNAYKIPIAITTLERAILVAANIDPLGGAS